MRAATHESHRAVEHLVPFFAENFSIQAYAEWLGKMHCFYRVVDTVVTGSDFETQTGWHYKPRVALIEYEWGRLAVSEPAQPVAIGKRLTKLHRLRTAGAIAGLVYLAEGSALGGQVLRKQLQRRLGINPLPGESFLAPHGEHPQAVWHAYVQLLDRLDQQTKLRDEIIEGARLGFDVLLCHLSHVRDTPQPTLPQPASTP